MTKFDTIAIAALALCLWALSAIGPMAAADAQIRCTSRTVGGTTYTNCR